MADCQLELIVNQIRLLSPDELVKLVRRAAGILEQKQVAAATFVVPPVKGGTTNCAFHSFRASQRNMKAPQPM